MVLESQSPLLSHNNRMGLRNERIFLRPHMGYFVQNVTFEGHNFRNYLLRHIKH